jgi:hypothetical protein
MRHGSIVMQRPGVNGALCTRVFRRVNAMEWLAL